MNHVQVYAWPARLSVYSRPYSANKRKHLHNIETSAIWIQELINVIDRLSASPESIARPTNDLH